MKKKAMLMSGVVVALLLIPAISMQFTDQVRWRFFDFALMGLLLLICGSAIVLVTEKIRIRQNRLIFITVIVLAFLLVWAELAVGIVGTVLAGS